MRKLIVGGAAFAGAIALMASGAAAYATPVSDTFTITTLTLDNPITVDYSSCIDDDGGLVALSGANLLVGGDEASCTSEIPGLSTVSALDNVSAEDGSYIFTNLSDQSAYRFVYQSGTSTDYELTGIVPINSDLTVGSSGALSSTIAFDENGDVGPDSVDCIFIASGWNRVAVWDQCLGTVYDINIATGDVTTLTDQATHADYAADIAPLWDGESESWNNASSGIVEYVDGVLRFVLPGEFDGETVGIYRFVPSAPTTAPELMLDFGSDTPDLYSFTLATTTNQWCGHSEYFSGVVPVIDGAEAGFCMDATFSTTAPAAAAPSAPALASTGTDATALTVGGLAGALALAIGAALVATRRRAAAQ